MLTIASLASSLCVGSSQLLLRVCVCLAAGEDSERGSDPQTTEESQEPGCVRRGGEEDGVTAAAQGVHRQVHVPKPPYIESPHIGGIQYVFFLVTHSPAPYSFHFSVGIQYILYLLITHSPAPYSFPFSVGIQYILYLLITHSPAPYSFPFSVGIQYILYLLMTHSLAPYTHLLFCDTFPSPGGFH